MHVSNTIMRTMSLLAIVSSLCIGCIGNDDGTICDSRPDLCAELANEIAYPGPCRSDLVYENGRLVGMHGERDGGSVRWKRSIEYATDGAVARVADQAKLGEVEEKLFVWTFGQWGSESVETTKDLRITEGVNTGFRRAIFSAEFRLDSLDLIWETPANGKDHLLSWEEGFIEGDVMRVVNSFSVEYEVTPLEDGERQVKQRERAANGATVRRATFIYDKADRIVSIDGAPYRWDGDRLVAKGIDPYAIEYVYDVAGNLRVAHIGDDVIELPDYSCWR